MDLASHIADAKRELAALKGPQGLAGSAVQRTVYTATHNVYVPANGYATNAAGFIPDMNAYVDIGIDVIATGYDDGKGGIGQSAIFGAYAESSQWYVLGDTIDAGGSRLITIALNPKVNTTYTIIYKFFSRSTGRFM